MADTILAIKADVEAGNVAAVARMGGSFYAKKVDVVSTVRSMYGWCQRQARPLFLAIHQQLALPPALAKKIDAASRYWSKSKLRFTAPAWAKAIRYTSTVGFAEILAYKGLMAEFRKYIALAKEALAAGVSHSAEASKTTLQAGPFRLVNTAHFSDEQMQQIGSVVHEAAKRLTDIGLARVCYGDMLMSRQISSRSNVLAFYLTKHDEMFVRGDVKDSDRANLLWTICHELGHRLQFKFMSEKGAALIRRFYMSTKRQERLAKSEAHYFPAAGTKIETPIGELTFLGHERLGVVAYLDPKGQKRLATTQSWQASMGAWDRHYGRGAESLFVSHYASKDAYESFAEMVAACATGKTKPAFVATLREILKADGIELLIDETPAQQAPVARHEERRDGRDDMRRQDQLVDEYAAWVAAERKRGAEDVPLFETWLTNIRAPYKANPITLSPTKADWPGKSRGVALSSLPQDELTRGIEHEREHIPNRLIAQRIAADHLVEDPAYYSHLEAMERQQNPVHPSKMPPSERDLEDAVETSNEQFDRQDSVDDFDLSYVGLLPVEALQEYDDLGSWLEFGPDDMSGTVDESMGSFRGREWARRAETWLKHGIPPIVVIETPDGSMVGDGRGRVNFASMTGMALPTWLLRKRVQHRKANPRGHDALPLAEIKRWEPLAAASGVSDVARGPSGFLTAYKRAGGRLDRLTEAWRSKREAFIARHMAQAKSERMFDDGLPTRRHLALIMWAYSPEADRLREANPRKANPIDDTSLALLKEASGASSKVKWREVGAAREYLIVTSGKDEVTRIAEALASNGAAVTHDFYADPENGYRALHLCLRGGETVQIKTARMATLAYAAQGVEDVDLQAFGKVCDLAAYADEGDAHAARRFDEIPVTELRSQIARRE